MAAKVGIVLKFGLDAPAGGYAHETRKKSTAEWVPTQDENGVTVEQDALPYTKGDVSMKGVGIADFALVVTGSTAPGVVKILSAKGGEGNKAKSDFEYTGEVYDNTPDGEDE